MIFGEPPLPMKNRNSLKVSLSVMGFCQKIRLMSEGQELRGQNASPLIEWKRSCRFRMVVDLELLEKFDW